ncbi:hypothetical protein TFLX_03037 [Thermoflexales bacterium]|jgi:hypothetical protein|nr:hypothetical protein TFLX_03037 [Thermoflexales bacterium]
MDKPIEAPVYCITVQGRLDEAWGTWLHGLTIETAEERGLCVTRLAGEIVDQPALRGLLNQLWDWNLTLITVTRL